MRAVRRETLPVLVAEEIERDILKGHFRPGDKLPSEAELCRTLDVARPTLREALRILEGEKLVKFKYGEGVYVVDKSRINHKANVFLKMTETLELLKFEFRQLEEEGIEIPDEITRTYQNLLKRNSPEEVEFLYDSLNELPQKPNSPYKEPSDLEEIVKEISDKDSIAGTSKITNVNPERIYGAWLGRCVGCTLGKPVEGWAKKQIESYLKKINAYPLNDYFLYQPDKLENDDQPFHPFANEATRETISFVPRDDDLDYTILNCLLVKENGYDFSTQDVAESWLSYLPLKMVYTAERQAYLNLARGLKPPATATYRNPYREWIGAQIRADAFGYLTPGNPKLAASLAFKDASLSHTKNGIYGEMFIAAVISASLATNKLQEAINMGLAQVPSKSRLHELVEKVLNWKARALTWQEAWEKMNEAYGKYHWVHTLPNLAIVLIALLWGENNIRRTVSIAVMGGWDTDCNGATAGSIMGALNGKNAIPSDLTDLFNDRIKSAVFGHSDEKLGNYVQQTISIINSTKSS